MRELQFQLVQFSGGRSSAETVLEKMKRAPLEASLPILPPQDFEPIGLKFPVEGGNFSIRMETRNGTFVETLKLLPVDMGAFGKGFENILTIRSLRGKIF